MQPVTTLTYTYDLAGNRLSMAGASILNTQYAYDGLNRPIRINAQNVVAKNLEYDALGRLTRVSGDTAQAYTYDAASQLLTLNSTVLSTPIEALTYAYDLAGNRSSLTDRLGLHTYGYDALNRLRSADHPATGPWPDEAFTYDPVGNRLTSHLSATHLHDSANRLLEDVMT